MMVGHTSFFSFDITHNTIAGWCDFEYLFTDTINLANNSLNFKRIQTDYPIVIGQDMTMKYPISLNASLDDVIIFNNALNPEELSQLKDYYTNF